MTWPRVFASRIPPARAAARALALTGVILATLLAALERLGHALDAGPCETAVLASLPSPQGAWTAVLDEYHCPADFGGDDIVAELTINPSNEPTRSTYVLNIDTAGHDDERPRVLWTAPHVLQVTVYARSYLKLLTRQVGPVHIDLRFDPPDPAARTAFLHETHQDPQPGE